MNSAKTKIYAWMIHKGVKTIDDVPPELRVETMTAYNALYSINKKNAKLTRRTS